MFHFTSKLTFVVGSTAGDSVQDPNSSTTPESDLSRIAVVSFFKIIITFCFIIITLF